MERGKNPTVTLIRINAYLVVLHVMVILSGVCENTSCVFEYEFLDILSIQQRVHLYLITAFSSQPKRLA